MNQTAWLSFYNYHYQYYIYLSESVKMTDKQKETKIQLLLIGLLQEVTKCL